jgi:hypothetical protein
MAELLLPKQMPSFLLICELPGDVQEKTVHAAVVKRICNSVLISLSLLGTKVKIEKLSSDTCPYS